VSAMSRPVGVGAAAGRSPCTVQVLGHLGVLHDAHACPASRRRGFGMPGGSSNTREKEILATLSKAAFRLSEPNRMA
jgi:hypothetical protein